MSDFTAKNQRGLMEAYASMYQQPVQEDKVEDVEYQEYEIDSDALYESIVDYLVSEGYVETEKQAVAMIPHLSEGWFSSIVGNIIISEHFISCVNEVIEEGCDLSHYTWGELYEVYTGHLNQVLTEDYADVMGGGLGLPINAVLTGIGAVGSLAKSMSDRRQRDVEQQLQKAKRILTPKPQTVLKSTTPDPWAGSSTVPPKTPQATTQTVSIKGASGSGGSGNGGNGGNGGDNKPPKSGIRSTIGNWFKTWSRTASENKAKADAARVARQSQPAPKWMEPTARALQHPIPKVGATMAVGSDIVRTGYEKTPSSGPRALTLPIGALGYTASALAGGPFTPTGRAAGASTTQSIKDFWNQPASHPLFGWRAGASDQISGNEAERQRIQNLFPKKAK